MPGDEKLWKDHEESDSDEEEEVETVPKVDIDVSKLTPLSPEVISKQVSADRSRFPSLFSGISSGYYKSRCASLVIGGGAIYSPTRVQAQSVMSHTENRP
jgi:hypothetical protein